MAYLIDEVGTRFELTSLNMPQSSRAAAPAHREVHPKTASYRQLNGHCVILSRIFYNVPVSRAAGRWGCAPAIDSQW
jgi:hypothetical protein